IAAAERNADWVGHDSAVFSAGRLAHDLLQKAPLSRTRFGASLLDATTAQDAWLALLETVRWAGFLVANRRVLLDCVREVLGNPFRPVILRPSWQTGTAAGLAEAIYAEAAFDRLPILGDALEDAGCANEEILNHCRQPGVHVRGCWVVDLVLGKE